MSATLSKKQQKALLFRQNQKAKKKGETVPGDLPEQDLPEDDDVVPHAVVVQSAGKAGESSSSSRKRKRAAGEDAKQGEEQSVQDLTGGIKGKVKDVGKGKGKAWEDGEEGGDEGKAGKKSKKEIKQRFILFIGNLGFKTTAADVAEHFREAVGHAPQVRLLTTKPTKPSQPAKSRGIAFLELPTSSAMQAALKLHHTQLAGRRINVELTAGGGGKGEGRSKKVKERNERVGVQRVKREEKEREAAAAEGGTGAEGITNGNGGRGAASGEADKRSGDNERVQARAGNGKNETGLSAGVSTEYVDGFKIRNGRRVKVKGPSDSAASTDGQARSGWKGAQSSSRPPPQRGGRRWEPTGANALVVG